MIPYGRQDITEEDITALEDVLRSDFLTQGPVVPRFEETVRIYCGTGHGVAVNSATSALHLACLALGLGPGGLLWTSPITFVASANSALYCGADVDFVDIEPQSFNMDIECLEEKLRRAKKEDRLPDVVMPVHMCGQSCDMAAIGALADKYGFGVIEDASHAIGGTYLGKPVGSCTYSDITVLSFHPVKIITTGEGGMALTNNAKLAQAMRDLRSHGITRNEARMHNASHGPWYYEQLGLGYNYRMTDILAALGISQMQRIDTYIMKRHKLAGRYDFALKGFPLITPWRNPDCRSGFHLYVIQLLDNTGCSREQVFKTLRAAGIGVNVHYIPVYLQPYYANLGFIPGYCPNAEYYYERAITLPLHPKLTIMEQDTIVDTLRRILELSPDGPAV